MAASHKAEFPPLLADGLHKMSLAELKKLCVTDFPLSKRREPIMRSLESLLSELAKASIKAEAWLDGSFLTKKIEPDDVDLVIVIQQPDWPTKQEGKDALARVARQQFVDPVKCDSYLNIEYPDDDPRHIFGIEQREYWLKQFGHARTGDKKGIAVVAVLEK